MLDVYSDRNGVIKIATHPIAQYWRGTLSLSLSQILINRNWTLWSWIWQECPQLWVSMIKLYILGFLYNYSISSSACFTCRNSLLINSLYSSTKHVHTRPYTSRSFQESSFGRIYINEVIKHPPNKIQNIDNPEYWELIFVAPIIWIILILTDWYFKN